MNEYRFEDLVVGTQESFSETLTEEKMEAFLTITGDTNPLHRDKEFACQHGYADCVVYGMLSASLFSTLAGVYLPGKYCLIQQVEAKFVAPVYVGDELTVLGIVKEKNETVRQVVLKVEIRNQKGEKVVRGTMNIGFLE